MVMCVYGDGRSITIGDIISEEGATEIIQNKNTSNLRT